MTTRLPEKVWDILVVCTGNMCRSPMATAALRAKLVAAGIAGVIVRSAGTNTTNGVAATPDAIEVAESRDLDISYHRSKQLDEKMLRQTDLILVMEKPRHFDAIAAIDPDAVDKTFLLSDFADGPWRGDSIPDPIGMSYGLYELVFDRMSEMLDGLVEKLAEHRKSG